MQNSDEYNHLEDPYTGQRKVEVVQYEDTEDYKPLRLLSIEAETTTDEEDNEENKLIKALIHSNKVVIEDLMRESLFMIPEAPKTHELLIRLSKNPEVQDVANKLLEQITVNE